GGSVSPLPEPGAGATLVDSGPYRWMRHPIYAGLVVGMLGVAVFVRSAAAAAGAGVVGVLLWLKARYEEARLRMAVPGYVEYSRRVRGRMVPLPPYSKPPTVLRCRVMAAPGPPRSIDKVPIERARGDDMARRARDHRKEIPGYDETRPAREERKRQHRQVRHAANQILSMVDDPDELTLPDVRRHRHD